LVLALVFLVVIPEGNLLFFTMQIPTSAKGATLSQPRPSAWAKGLENSERAEGPI
jgi:hypothetical protein